ncbi:isochorismatase family cysteine hydrolase [Desulfosporosinus hippei]|uniref:Nicotinamidase-related amidase n=1 Tax=Desulfosporosinus hippei DSM 8344 TaxID=1121419 RepID=A0A1G8E4Q5_9FIRM|nr:isochorismatase family cysteine hydrolase [Desulfosporosinus hippei]SDH64844.1 Nicotinamidase-related amidase [Desulfosporosinus hippei DSM 8344]
MFDKGDFLGLANQVLSKQVDVLNNLGALSASDLDLTKTVLVVIDMVNGFAKEGALYSPRIEGLIAEIGRVMQICIDHGISIVAFADNHTNESPEFKRYPIHCGYNSKESEVVDEFRGLCRVFNKNSINGYLEEEFREWLNVHPDINTFIVVGDCTDICIASFALTAQADFDGRNRDSSVIVLTQGVETFDIPGVHDGDVYQMLGLMYISRR